MNQKQFGNQRPGMKQAAPQLYNHNALKVKNNMKNAYSTGNPNFAQPTNTSFQPNNNGYRQQSSTSFQQESYSSRTEYTSSTPSQVRNTMPAPVSRFPTANTSAGYGPNSYNQGCIMPIAAEHENQMGNYQPVSTFIPSPQPIRPHIQPQNSNSRNSNYFKSNREPDNHHNGPPAFVQAPMAHAPQTQTTSRQGPPSSFSAYGVKQNHGSNQTPMSHAQPPQAQTTSRQGPPSSLSSFGVEQNRGSNQYNQLQFPPHPSYGSSQYQSEPVDNSPMRGRPAYGKPYTPGAEASNNFGNNGRGYPQSQGAGTQLFSGKSKRPNTSISQQEPAKKAKLGEFKLEKKDSDMSLHFLTTTIQAMKNWAEFSQRLPLLFEVFGIVSSSVIRAGEGIKEFHIKDEKDIARCIFYEIDRDMPSLNPGQWYRCVGKWNTSMDCFHCISVRRVLEEERKVYKLRINATDKAMRAWRSKHNEF